MKILISGATGFIGKNLVKNLLDKKHTVHAIVRSSTKKDTLDKRVKVYVFDNDIAKLTTFMSGEKFDGVIHLASLFLAQHTPENIEELTDSNIFFGTALLDASVKSNTSWFINTGTFWQHYKNKKYSPVNLYAATKQAFEVMAQYYIETSSINFVTLKLNDTFGPGDTRQKIFNLWMKISASKEVFPMSPGKQLIHINYIDDVVEAYTKLIQAVSKDTQKKMSGKSFALSSPSVMPLKNLATIFEKVSGKKLNIIWGGRAYRPREVMTPWSKGEVVPGWKPKTSLQNGIRKIIKLQK